MNKQKCDFTLGERDAKKDFERQLKISITFRREAPIHETKVKILEAIIARWELKYESAYSRSGLAHLREMLSILNKPQNKKG